MSSKYFRVADTPQVFSTLDEWIRHRLRMVQLRQWKRGTTIYRELKRLGANEDAARQVAATSHRWWRNSRMVLHTALLTSYYDRMGIPRLASLLRMGTTPGRDGRTSGFRLADASTAKPSLCLLAYLPIVVASQ